eukprot:Rhum_TRINITY_DN13382_c0_g2::Rhum_TRINITY_DN13382_c0_g2_i1::g.59670::m.59670
MSERDTMFEAYMQGSELGIHEEDPLPQYHQAGRATPPPPHTPTGRDNPYIQQQPNTTEYSATLAEQMTYTSGGANGYQYREMRQTRAQSIATPSAEDLPAHQSFAQPPLQLPVKPPKPPLHPSASAGSSGSNARSRTPSSTPPPQAHSPLPVQGRQQSPQPQQPLTSGADRGYHAGASSSTTTAAGGGGLGPDPRDAELRQLQQRAAQDAAALEKQRLMLKMQTEELMENERVIQRLQASGGGGGGGAAEVRELRAQLDEAGQLTEAAGELLKKVQGDLDGAQQAAEAIVQRVFPGELERLSFDAVPDLVRFVGTRVEEVLQGTLEAAGKLEEELTRSKQEAARAAAAAAKPAARSADVQRLEGELDAAAARNTELTTNIAALQEEVATLRLHEAELAHTDGQKQGELEDDVKQLRSQLNRAEQARTDAERQRQSQAQLLKMTEQAYKKLEEELRAARRSGASHEAAGYIHDAEGQTMQSELHKLGAVSNGPSVWKKRYFFANTTCLQYMDKPEDVGKPALVKGERYYASQHAFVPRFVSDLAHAGDGAGAAIHPRATDPHSFYFGFLPRHDNTVSTQAFLLRTSSRETWQMWCAFLSRMPYSSATPSREALMRSPEVIGGVTPPPRDDSRDENFDSSGARGSLALGAELKKTEEALRAMMDEQAPLRERVQQCEAELADARSEIERLNGDLHMKSRTVDVYQREAVKNGDEVNTLQRQCRTLQDAVESEAREVSTLREEVARLRTEAMQSIASGHGKALERPVCTSAATATGHDLGVTASGAQTDELPAAAAAADGGRGAERERELERKLRRMTEEQEEVSRKLKDQEAAHDAQIAAFCEQVLQDMDAIKMQGKMEVARRDADWQKEVAIWQQLVAEKEQQITMAAHRTAGHRGADVSLVGDMHDSGMVVSGGGDAQWKLIGSGAGGSAVAGGVSPATVLSLKLSTTAADAEDAPKTFGTRIAVDKRKLAQVSVTDNPAARDSMSRTWKFRSMGADGSAVSLSLSIVPGGGGGGGIGEQQRELRSIGRGPSGGDKVRVPPAPRGRRGSASSMASHARSLTAGPRSRTNSPFHSFQSVPGSRRSSHVFVP